MLVFISDLHLTDGTSGETINAGAFRIFRERLLDLARAASWRTGAKYKPIDRLDLVLLGDILDVIRSSQWLARNTRPWSDPSTAAFQEKVAAITDAILEKNEKSIAILKTLHDPEIFSLPEAADGDRPKKAGKEAGADKRLPVETHIHYVIGNHDWFFGLSGAWCTDIRRSIVKAMGLSNSPDEPFPYDVDASDQIRRVCAAHQVFARHGDIYDRFNYEGRRDASSLGDAIVVELLSRFPEEVARQMGNQLPQECRDGLKEIDNVRPLLVVPAWIDGLLRRTCPDQQQSERVKAIWDDMADQFLRLQFVRDRDKWYQWNDLVDQLEVALKFSKGTSLRNLSRLLTWWSEFSTGDDEPFYKNALAEQRFKSRSARFIVYGHTHRQEIVPLDSSGIGRDAFNQMYMNAGTWRRVHELAKWNPNDEEFMSYDVMTYLAFFKDDERSGRPFESWSGALGAKPEARSSRS